MRLATAIAVLAMSSTASAGKHHEIEFLQASELLPWCQMEAQAYFAGKGIPTYQWTARYYESGNVLFVEGRIRVNGNDVPVNCRVAKGARERYVIVEVDDNP